MNKLTMHLKEKEVYGRPHLYPDCAISNHFCDLIGCKTLPLHKVEKIRHMGYTIQIDGNKARVLEPI